MENNLQERFRFSTEVSNDYFNCASDLNASARILYAAQGSSEGHPAERLGLPSNFDFRIALSRPVLLNAGLALELILKACLVRSKKFNPKKHFKHDLVELAGDLGLSYAADQVSTLRIFTDSITWFGRYPHPKSSNELQQNKTNWNNLRKVEKFGNITVTASDEKRWPTFQNYGDLWQMAEQQYWQIEPSDAREFRR
jgi:hypothetical protein